MISIARTAIVFWLSCIVLQRNSAVTAEDETVIRLLLSMNSLLEALKQELKDLKWHVQLSCTSSPLALDLPQSLDTSSENPMKVGLENDSPDYINDGLHGNKRDVINLEGTSSEQANVNENENEHVINAEKGEEYDWFQEFTSFIKNTIDGTKKDPGHRERKEEEEDVENLSSTDATTATSKITSATELPYPIPPPRTECPSSFQLLAESCFIIVSARSDRRTWEDAQTVCKRYGGDLAAPWRLQLLQEYLISHNYSDPFWVGAEQSPDLKSWKWLSGRPMKESEWKEGVTSRKESHLCVILDKWSEFKAITTFCNNTFPFICEDRND